MRHAAGRQRTSGASRSAHHERGTDMTDVTTVVNPATETAIAELPLGGRGGGRPGGGPGARGRSPLAVGGARPTGPV